MNLLVGKRALVTGGSRGIGRSIAIALARNGAHVAVNFVHAVMQAKVVQGEIQSTGSRCLLVQADVSQWDEVQRMAAIIQSEWGGLDILVNNAGIHRGGRLTGLKIDDWDKVINTNLKGAFMCSKVFTPFFVEQNWGRIINVSSVIGIKGYPGDVIYASSKAGLIGFTKSLALELSSNNVTVNAVAPGFIKTEILNDLSEQSMIRINQMIPLRRLGLADEVGEVVSFLASPLASYITGAVIPIDGGVLCN